MRRILNHKCCIEENKQDLPSVQIKQQRIQNPQASLSDGERERKRERGKETERDGEERGNCNSQCFLGWYFHCVLLQSGHIPLFPIGTGFVACNVHACTRFTKKKKGQHHPSVPIDTKPSRQQTLLHNTFFFIVSDAITPES